MKLKNKLIPFVGIAALSATVAPIALTSCGSKTSGAIDLREWYNPTIEKHAYATMTSDEVAKLYFCGDKDATWGDWLDEDDMNERLLQDYLWGSSMWVQYCEQNAMRTSANRLGTYTSQFAPVNAEQTYFNLLGVNGIVSMGVGDIKAKEADSLTTNVAYDKYDVTVSDVRISHANKYTSAITYEEVPTISFQINFDIDYVGESSWNTNDKTITLSVVDNPESLIGGMEVFNKVDVYGQGKTTTTQNHKGSITVANVPIKLEYDTAPEIGTKSWMLQFDYDAIVASETISTIPFAIYGTDSVTYTTESQYNGGQDKNSGTRVYNFDYYSNMLWEKLLTTSQISKADDVYKNAYDKYIEEYAVDPKNPTAEEKAAATVVAKAARQEFVVEVGVENAIDYVNEQFFNTVSYYLISIECKD